jgi:hypothetical protein
LLFHQVLTSPGLSLTRSIRSLTYTKSGTTRLVRRYILLTNTFLISALIHATGSLYVSRVNHKPPTSGGAFLFYGIQAAILLSEDAICSILGATDGKDATPLRKAVGYAVIAAFSVYAIPRKLASAAKGQGIGAAGETALLCGVRNLQVRAQAAIWNPFPNLWLGRLFFG